MCLLIAGTICIIPMYIIYKTVPKPIPKPIETRKEWFFCGLWVVTVVTIGLMLNFVITQSGLLDYSDGFERASETLSDGSLVVKILCNAIVIPILEELLIRGIVAGQLYLWYGMWPAVVLSSICFGIMHNNIVQFIYALIIGILLGLMYVKNKRIVLCILTHGLLNLLVIMLSY